MALFFWVPTAIGVGLLISSLASVGLSAASAMGAFTKDPPDPPERDAPEIEAKRRAAAIGASRAQGQRSTLLSAQIDAPQPAADRKTLLGQTL